jgi:hypothetical protein
VSAIKKQIFSSTIIIYFLYQQFFYCAVSTSVADDYLNKHVSKIRKKKKKALNRGTPTSVGDKSLLNKQIKQQPINSKAYGYLKFIPQ